MIEGFRKFITKELGLNDQKVLLAVSGGVDSVCMVDLFHKTGLNFVMAHCNFKLRGEASDQDEVFVRELASQLGVDFHSTSFDTFSYSRDHGVSIQMAARELRYNWLRAMKSDQNAHFIATAHHLNDSLETALFNLAKGTGISGLKGILPQSEDVIRPLLFATKDQILSYAQEQSLKWREDASNRSIKYQRNFIRHQVIPPLKQKINQSIEQTFSETAERLRAVEKVFEQHIEELRSRYVAAYPTHVAINTTWVRDHTDVPLIAELLKTYGFNYKQSRELFDGGELSGGSYYSEQYWLVKDRDQLVITTRDVHYKDVLINGDEQLIDDHGIHLEVKQCDKDSLEILPSADYAYLDYAKLKFPLVIRSWQEGDRFQPLGMKGKKKVSDFMIDQKIPVNLKKRVRILTSNDQIVWLIGLRIDDQFKITPQTKRVYRLKILRPDA